MKPTQLFMTVSCLLLCAVIGQAQQDRKNLGKTPGSQLAMKTSTKGFFRTFWNGRNADFATLNALFDPDVRTAWGISDEQNERAIDHIMKYQENPELNKLEEELARSGALDRENIDKATEKKIRDAAEKLSSWISNVAADAWDNVLTPEQKRKIHESQLASMAEMPIISPGMFDALDLTDTQKKQMAKIKKELEPEFEKTLDHFVNGDVALTIKAWEERDKEGLEYSPELHQAIIKKLMAEDPETKKFYEETLSQSKAFAEKLKTRMFDVLTDEQWNRLQKLIDNPPEHALVFRKVMKEQSGEAEEGEKSEKTEWQPGPNSWKPGDAIPEEYRQERNTRRQFPRTESP